MIPASLALVSVVGLSIYDIRRQRIPNLITLPLLLLGMILHFPGAMETWFACLLLFLGWRFHALGAGDAKLWMALLWLAPVALAQAAVLVMGLSLFLTALAQIAWRRLRQHHQATGKRSPAAWRAIPYTLWLALTALAAGA